MKRIAVIGANSYIARNVIHKISNEYDEYELRLYDCGERQLDNINPYVPVRILDSESVRLIDMDCDVIFMFVGKTGSARGFDQFNEYIDINERALLNVLNEYRRQNSKAKIIFPSTRLVYKGKPEPQKEDAEKEFKTVYAMNKYACEQYLEQYHRVYGVRYCIFRICIPYGTLVPGASSYGTAEFMLSSAKKGSNITLYGDGKQRRTLTFMGDLCNLLIAGAMNRKCINDVYNVGGENYSLIEMAELIAQKYNVGIHFVKWPEVEWKIESGDTVFDSQKLDSILKLNYTKTFREWVREG